MALKKSYSIVIANKHFLNIQFQIKSISHKGVDAILVMAGFNVKKLLRQR